MKTKTQQKNTKKIPKLRFGGFEGEWEEKMLGEVAFDMIQGVNTAIDIPEYANEGIPMLKANDVIDGKIDFEKVEHISHKTYCRYSSRFKINRNDFLFSMNPVA